MSQATLDLGTPKPVSDQTFGAIHIFDKGGFLVDAEPHVMIKVRKLFPSGASAGAGSFTHNCIRVPKTTDIGKDLLWLNDRFPMSMSDRVWNEISELAHRYDVALKAASKAILDETFKPQLGWLTMAKPPRPYQAAYANHHSVVRRCLNADWLGAGKTVEHIATICNPDARPALIVAQPHLLKQWKNKVNEFLPDAKVKILKPGIKKVIGDVDVAIIAFTSLCGWEDLLIPYGFRSIGGDEIQELRNIGTEKRRVFRALVERSEYSSGYSNTPIYNMGAEAWSVFDAVSPGCLGDRSDFVREWCTEERVNDPNALNSYLKSRGLLVRRKRSEVYGDDRKPDKQIITLDGDLESLRKIQDVAKHLALSALSNKVGESADALRDLDWKLRHATGIAKAKPVASLVRMICESGRKVFLTGWHRDVYDIWLRELNDLFPVMHTGTETGPQKEAAKQKFIEDELCRVFICSNRSGAGLDGLQNVCDCVVIGELDWSPHVIDQLIGRIDRDPQPNPVDVYLPVIDDGADPFMIERLGDKRSQSEGIFDGVAGVARVLGDDDVSQDRLRAMAEAYLAMIGEPIPNPEPQTGLHADVAKALRRVQLPTNTEKEMQDALWSVLPDLLPGANVEREVRVGQRSRLDFLVSNGSERIAIELKIDQTGKGSVYRQVRRYAEEAQITGLVLLAPWSGVANFSVEGVPVTVVDWAKAKI